MSHLEARLTASVRATQRPRFSFPIQLTTLFSFRLHHLFCRYHWLGIRNETQSQQPADLPSTEVTAAGSRKSRGTTCCHVSCVPCSLLPGLSFPTSLAWHLPFFSYYPGAVPPLPLLLCLSPLLSFLSVRVIVNSLVCCFETILIV